MKYQGSSIKFLLKSEILKLKSRLRKLTERQFLLILVTSDFLIKIFRIWDPSTPYFDEGPFYIKAARAYLNGVTTVNPEHPPLAKLIMAASIKIFGDNPIGWRLPGILLGTLGVLVTYFLAKRLTGSKRIAALASIFLSFELGWFVLSRVATIEIYLATFLLLGSFFVVKLFQESKLINIVPAGIFLGAALASKWSAVLLIVWLFIFLTIFWKERFLAKLVVLGTITGLIGGVYFLSYLPYLLTHNLVDLAKLHLWMVQYHTGYIPVMERRLVLLKGLQFHPYPAWSWIFDPSYPLFGKTFGREASKAILFFFNPVLLWGGFVAAAVLIREQFKKLETKIIFLLGCFLALYLPWYLSPRFTLLYYLLSAMPFLVICFALLVFKLRRTIWFWALPALASVVFLAYYPMVSALKIPYLYSRIVSGVIEFVEIPTTP